MVVMAAHSAGKRELMAAARVPATVRVYWIISALQFFLFGKFVRLTIRMGGGGGGGKLI